MSKKKQLYLVTYIGGEGYWDGGRWNDGETIEGTTRNPKQWIKQSNSDRGWIEMGGYTNEALLTDMEQLYEHVRRQCERNELTHLR